MKPTIKSKAKAQATGQSKQTIYPAPTTVAELNARFAESIGRPREGKNTYVEAFLLLMDRCMSLYPKAFSLYEVNNLNFQSIPANELESLFSAYVEKLVDWEVIDKIIGAYDYPVYARR